MATKEDDGGLRKGNVLPPHGPKHEGRDPLTVGKTTYGEDVKGNSTFADEASEEGPTPEEEKAEEMVADQKSAEKPSKK